eukprot:COSAG01_NODE_1897_length_8967_cov_3.629003_9_plen_59_part_00
MALQVAPILEPGVHGRRVYFPGGAATKWKHHFSGHTYLGGTNVTVASTLDDFPLFVRL